MKQLWESVVRWWDSYPVPPTWRLAQFLWRWDVCIIAHALALKVIFGNVEENRAGEIILLLGSAFVALVWGRETCWRKAAK